MKETLKAFYRMVEYMLNDLIDRQVSFIYTTPTERYLNLFKERSQLIVEIP
ncbi:hypothetical protein [Sphingobacterium corticibacterium]|uniref:hypothetical protein n=1 Tax=Sphingobacterium corticibacterium TaxID=2484746 RepID=UPI0013EE4893|nr:hypothetical protein [Sphingobacterium corticibacterium]